MHSEDNLVSREAAEHYSGSLWWDDMTRLEKIASYVRELRWTWRVLSWSEFIAYWAAEFKAE